MNESVNRLSVLVILAALSNTSPDNIDRSLNVTWFTNIYFTYCLHIERTTLIGKLLNHQLRYILWLQRSTLIGSISVEYANVTYFIRPIRIRESLISVVNGWHEARPTCEAATFVDK